MAENPFTNPDPALSSESAAPAVDRALVARSDPIILSGAGWFWWIAGLSVVNTIMMHSGTDRSFVIGLGFTLLADVIFKEIKVIAFIIDAIALAIFFGFGFLSRKGHLWAFVTGIVLYTLDAGIYILGQDWMSVAFHGLALFYMIAARRRCAPRSTPRRNRPRSLHRHRSPAPEAYHSPLTRPRDDLCFARCFLASIIRSFCPRDFWRFCRRASSCATWAALAASVRRHSRRSASSDHASRRLTDWLRSRWQRTSTPVGRCRRTTVDEVLLIFCPPAPAPRMNCSSRSPGRTPRETNRARSDASTRSGKSAMVCFSHKEAQKDTKKPPPWPSANPALFFCAFWRLFVANA